MTRLKSLAPDWLTFLSGVLIVLSFPPWDITPLIWIAIVPWLFALNRAGSYRTAVIQGVWLGVFMSLGGFFWVAYVLRQFAELPWPVAILGLLLFSFIGQPQFMLFAPVNRFIRKRIKAPSVMSAAGLATVISFIYTGIDWALPKLFVDTLGHAFYRSPWIRQVADLGGAPLLTMLVFLVNDTVFTVIRRFRERREPSWYPPIQASSPQILFAAGLVTASITYGAFRSEQIRTITNSAPRSLQAGVIQGNIGDFDKIASERGVRGAATKVLDTFFSMSDQALEMTPKPEVIIWPETSYPSTFRTPQTATELARDQQLEAYSRSREIPLLFGGYDRRDKKDFNAFFFLDPRRQPGDTGEGDLQVYRKNVLLLFGEYIPGASHIKLIRDLFPQVGHFGRGPGPEVLSIPPAGVRAFPVLTNPVICYEVLFPNFVIAAARKGSQLILNITNDSWFGPWGEPQLHLALTVFRSIETRLPQLRATNTGISALILPDGQITHATGIMRPEILNVRVPLIEPVPTLMKTWGDWFGPAALIVGFCALLWLLMARPRRMSG